MNEQRTRLVVLALVAFAVLATPAIAQPIRGIEVDEQFAGSLMTITPSQGYVSATLRVIGPQEYEARGRFGGGPLSLDLIQARRPSPPGQDRKLVGRSAIQPADIGLPDGRYRYEARFQLPDGSEQIASGGFFVEHGVAVSRRRVRSDLASTRAELSSQVASLDEGAVSSGIGGESYTADDQITIQDAATDELTVLLLDNVDDGAGTSQYFGLLHSGRDLRFTECDKGTGTGCSHQTRMIILDTSGNVGVGTEAPAAQLHVEGSGIYPLRLTGYGHDFAFNVGSVGLWLYDDGGQEIAKFNHSASIDSLVVDGAGVGVGTASPTARLHVAGDARIEGDFSIASSRTLKTAFDQVTPAEMLAKVTELPVASWRYRNEDEDKRHIGPVAEDFQRLFGLGDGETISVIDAQGVTLAAIQGLQRELVEKDAQIAALNVRLAALEARLSGGDVN